MKFSELWLREWVNPANSSEELSSQITMAGLEVDGVDAQDQPQRAADPADGPP